MVNKDVLTDVDDLLSKQNLSDDGSTFHPVLDFLMDVDSDKWNDFVTYHWHGMYKIHKDITHRERALHADLDATYEQLAEFRETTRTQSTTIQNLQQEVDRLQHESEQKDQIISDQRETISNLEAEVVELKLALQTAGQDQQQQQDQPVLEPDGASCNVPTDIGSRRVGSADVAAGASAVRTCVDETTPRATGTARPSRRRGSTGRPTSGTKRRSGRRHSDSQLLQFLQGMKPDDYKNTNVTKELSSQLLASGVEDPSAKTVVDRFGNGDTEAARTFFKGLTLKNVRDI